MPGTILTETEVQCTKKAASIIAAHLDKRFTLRELADQVDLPAHQLKFAFAQLYTDLTIDGMLLYLRMERAQILLYIEKMPVKLIITFIGYKSVKGFTRDFKKVLHQEPENWINSLHHSRT